MWGSKKHNKCVVCGTTKKQHVGRGLCSTCYYHHTQGRLKNGGWSRKYTKCVSCGSVDYDHYAHGLCKLCYQTKWAEINHESAKASKNAYYLRHKDEMLKKARLAKNGEAGERLKASGVCAACGSSERLHVHHIDHKGHNVPKSQRNQNESNIRILCIYCHGSLHGVEGARVTNAKRKAKVQSKPGSKDSD